MSAKLFIVTGTSGVGKTSLLKQVLPDLPSVEVSVSYTTRLPRKNEIDGCDYHFVSLEEFDRMVDAERFLEHADVFQHRYGTARDKVDEKIDADISMVLEIDWQGAQQVKRKFPRAFSIFILPPSISTLRTRLQRRCQDSPEDIASRLDGAYREICHHNEFDALIVNEDFSPTCKTLKRLLLSQPLDPTELMAVEKALQKISEETSASSISQLNGTIDIE